VRFVSIEPFLKPFDVCLLQGLDWIIIGAMTGPRKAPPEKEWVDDVLRYARYHDIPVFLKDNLHWHEQVREWPKRVEG
jgi:protein gp37